MLKSIKSAIPALLILVVLSLNLALAAPSTQNGPRLFPYSANGVTFGYVDDSGRWAINPQFDYAGPFVEDLAVIMQDGRFGFIDAAGVTVIEPAYDFAHNFANGLAPVAVDGKFGYIDATGQMVIEPRFEEAHAFADNGLALVRPVQDYGYINQSGQFVILPQFETAFSFSEGLAPVVVNGEYGYIDDIGRLVINPQFDFASNFSEGLAAVAVNGLTGYIDPTGQIVIDPAYDFGFDFAEGLALVGLDGKIGYIDANGHMAVPPRFDFGESFSEGLAAVRLDDQIGYINRAGVMIIEPQFDQAGPFQDGMAPVEQAYEVGLIDVTGQSLFFLPAPVRPVVATTIIPFLPGVPAQVKDGICNAQSVIIPEAHAWRCIVEGDEAHQLNIFDPCLIAGDSQTLVCGANPVSGDPGFQLNLVEPLPEPEAPDAADAGDNRVWLVQLADGTICSYVLGVAGTINGKRANYTCADGSVLLNGLQPGPVWTAEQVALGDITRNDNGYTAGQIHQADIDLIWQAVDAAAVLEDIGLMPDAVSLNPGGLAETVTAQIRPAVPSAGVYAEPAHLRFAFDGEDLPEWGGVYKDQAQLLVYPLAAYRDVGNEEVDNRLEALETLLQQQPAAAENDIPLPPGFGDTRQNLISQVKYLDFDGGSGVRFITRHGLDLSPLTDYDTFYTFQGLTDDGNYYIAYYHPASTRLLPDSFEEVAALVDDYDAFVENFDAYLEETAATLDKAETTDFIPDLAELDALIESLQIQP